MFAKEVQTRTMKTCFLIVECSLPYAKVLTLYINVSYPKGGRLYRKSIFFLFLSAA